MPGMSATPPGQGEGSGSGLDVRHDTVQLRPAVEPPRAEEAGHGARRHHDGGEVAAPVRAHAEALQVECADADGHLALLEPLGQGVLAHDLAQQRRRVPQAEQAARLLPWPR
eukprot:scaffold31540_cov63-Phaeocystis_antarctica.AAC.4